MAVSIPELVHKISNEEATPLHLRSSNLSEELAKVVGKCLEKHPNKRYKSVKDFFRDFEKAYKTLPVFLAFSGGRLIPGIGDFGLGSRNGLIPGLRGGFLCPGRRGRALVFLIKRSSLPDHIYKLVHILERAQGGKLKEKHLQGYLGVERVRYVLHASGHDIKVEVKVACIYGKHPFLHDLQLVISGIYQTIAAFCGLDNGEVPEVFQKFLSELLDVPAVEKKSLYNLKAGWAVFLYYRAYRIMN